MFDRIQAKSKTVTPAAASPAARAQPFFSPKPKAEQADTDLIQREDGPAEGGESESADPLTAGAGVVWSQLNANNPRFSLFMGQQKDIWKRRLWTSQPTEYKVAMVSWGLINLGMVGGAFAADRRFRSDMINLLQDTNLLGPLGIIPYAEYFPLNSFQYTLPGDDGLYRFQFGFSLTPYLDLLTQAVPEIPDSTLTGSLSTSAGPDGMRVTGGNLSFGTLGGALTLQGGTSRGLPMLPTLFDNGDPFALPSRHMQSIPSVENPYSGMQDLRFTLSLDLARLFPNVLGGGRPRVQPKLKLGSPNDPLEREADQVAEQVVQRKCTTCGKEEEQTVRRKAISHVQRKCASCEEKEKETVMRKAHSDAGMHVGQNTEKGIKQAQGAGSAMNPGLRTEMEQGIGHDMSNVRIHTDNRSADLNRQVNARAFTHGRDVFFGKGEFNPDTKGGKRLIAHELTHVVQQGSAGGHIQRELAVAPTNPDAVPDPLTPEQIQDAIRYNDDRFRDISEIKLIRDVLGFAEEPVQFDEPLILAIAEYQAQYGLDDHDGRIGANTANVLAREFRAEGLRSEARQMRVRRRGVTRSNNIDVGGNNDLFDAILDHENARLTLRMKVKFNMNGAWPNAARERRWKRQFIRQIQRRWSGVFGLVPNGAHANRRLFLPYYRARIQVVEVANGQHYTANVAWATSHQGSSITPSTHTATLDAYDTRNRTRRRAGRNFRQRGGEHEFGHMLGLDHVDHASCITVAGATGNESACYGGNNRRRRGNIMGSGSRVDSSNYLPFITAMRTITGFAWKTTRRRRVR
ncbi:MAG: DUF4157 domain-containing protein [Bacteroidia bacterium]